MRHGRIVKLSKILTLLETGLAPESHFSFFTTPVAKIDVTTAAPTPTFHAYDDLGM